MEDEAIKMYNEFSLEKKQSLDVVIYNQLLYIFYTKNQLDRAIQIYEEMLSVGIKPNMKVYNAMVKIYCSLGDDVKTSQILNEMKKIGLPPDGTTRNALLLGAINSGGIQKGKALFDTMAPELNEGHYLTMVHEYAQRGMVADMKALIEQMKQKGYNSLKAVSKAFSSAVHEGKPETAIHLCLDLIKDGYQLDSYCYHILLFKLTSTNSIPFQEAVEFIYEHMRENNVVHKSRDFELRELRLGFKLYTLLHKFPTAKEIYLKLKKYETYPDRAVVKLFLNEYLSRNIRVDEVVSDMMKNIKSMPRLSPIYQKGKHKISREHPPDLDSLEDIKGRFF
eukprot:TRINITY_DN4850_c0_g1_i1.p1 TRINITY_DN4850_c0_g1~~TRINITY_DN4850_c0_g1_i1.p1  ORF type:complete len:390 (-),score=82.76 TRINITY_DN4850_c0_g1_i1:17-1024(-)